MSEFYYFIKFDQFEYRVKVVEYYIYYLNATEMNKSNISHKQVDGNLNLTFQF